MRLCIPPCVLGIRILGTVSRIQRAHGVLGISTENARLDREYIRLYTILLNDSMISSFKWQKQNVSPSQAA
jgi:hypothetical protein